MVWINIVLLLSVVVVYSEAKPDIEMSYKFSDTRCWIECSVTDMPANSEVLLSKISPEDNSVYYFSDGHPQYRIFNKGETYVTVQIMSNYLQWEGEYICTVREKTPNPTTWTTEPVYIKYTTSPKITGYKYDRNLNLGFLVNGTDFRFQCIATGIPKPNITWTKKGDEQFLSVGPMLHFPSITKAEDGKYFCTADNGVGRAIDIGTFIEVNRYKPTMKYDSIPIRTVTEYEINEYWVDGKMKVLVQGCPDPTVTWWKESENGRKKITEENNSYEHGFIIARGWDVSCYTDNIENTEYSLKMHRFNKTDLGTYVAKAESILGIVELKFIIRLETD
ncbi:hemicentin-1-like isoform X2 [Mytilus californianus]|uniref:hemicentin-1-like isoform X2 n=1 Tax=Mytilus californianus TaxID=6549 RepID=UPI0022455E89|nr:hemicentin-1-like isoform X2 [Mytilus californianus]